MWLLASAVRELALVTRLALRSTSVLGLGAGIKGMHSHTRTDWKVLKQFTQTHMKRERKPVVLCNKLDLSKLFHKEGPKLICFHWEFIK